MIFHTPESAEKSGLPGFGVTPRGCNLTRLYPLCRFNRRGRKASENSRFPGRLCRPVWPAAGVMTRRFILLPYPTSGGCGFFAQRANCTGAEKKELLDVPATRSDVAAAARAGYVPAPPGKSPHRATTRLWRADARACCFLVTQVEQAPIFETGQGLAGVPPGLVLLARRWNTSGTEAGLFHLRTTGGTPGRQQFSRKWNTGI